MERKRKILMLILTLTITTLVLNPIITKVKSDIPNEPHNPNAMWIEPSLVNATGLSIGYRFNVTLWINLSVSCGAWQFRLLYDKSLLNATGCGYTAESKSDFFKNITMTMPVAPVFDVENDTHDYVTHAESWIMGDFRSPGYGSLSWVEFEMMAEPLTTLDISTYYHATPSKTFALDPDMIDISLNVHDTDVIPEFSSWLAVILLSLTFLAALIAAKKIK